ncbi:MAG: cytochrome c oxidase assembly protein [Thermoactinomyces sp.]
MTAVDTFFQIFLYPENWDYKLNLVFLLVALIYLLLTGPFRKRLKEAEPVPGWKKLCFLLGLIFYYFSLGSPLDLLAHELFSMHMLQMSVMFFVVPPLLLLGIPTYLLLPVLRIRWIRGLLSFFTRPIISMFFFNVLMWIYHVPPIFEAIMSSHINHVAVHALLLFAALCMWWPIIGPVPDMDRLKPLLKLALIFGNGILLTPACAMITFTDSILYPSYSHMSDIVPIMSPIHDQQLGGVIMKVIQEIVYIFAIGLVFVKWMRMEREKDEQERLEWEEQGGVLTRQE